MTKKNLHFIINPICGTGKQKNIISQIDTEIDTKVFDVHLHYTKQKGHARNIAKTLTKNPKNILIAVGGDGTINEIAQEMVYSKCILGIVPTGSGNGLSRHLHIPQNISKALKIIHRLRDKKIDSCSVNGYFFINVSGIGYEAHVANCFSKSKKRGMKTYLKLMLSEWWRYRVENYKIEIDNKIVFDGKAAQISFANGTQFGNNAVISPNSFEDDGLLELCILEPFIFYQVPYLLFSLMTKKIHKYKKMHIFSCKKANIQSIPLKMHLDGEIENKKFSSFNLEVLEKSIRILN
tara:strand:+ start:3313 stop:4191 length:879 start_codon:yes stop_codon:yes gene_type:complete